MRPSATSANEAFDSERLGGSRDSGVSVVVLRGLVEAVEQKGVARSELLGRLDLPPGVLSDPEGRLPWATIYLACEAAVTLTEEPALGLHWADALSERTFVPISHLIAHSSSLRDGFELLSRYFQLLCDQTVHRFLDIDHHLPLQCLPLASESPIVQRFSAEMMVGGFWRLIGSFSPRARPERACFAFPAPSHAAEYARFFEGAERFDQPFTGIVLDGALLVVPSPQRDDDVRIALEELAAQRLRRIQRRTPYAVRVREHLVEHAWPHRTDMPSVARAMHISVRSLRRRLVAEGTSYDEVLHEALAIVAKRFLRNPNRTIQAVAYDMGFSDASTFHRAFKRWTGTTPNAFRERELGLDGRG